MASLRARKAPHSQFESDPLLDQFMPGYKARELILRTRTDRLARPQAVIAEMKTLGWSVLSGELPPDQFATFHEPGYVKILWTSRADTLGPAESMARTETRFTTTDPAAHARFRQYWSFFLPGIILIRRISLGLVKKEAERRARSVRRRLTNRTVAKSDFATSEDSYR